MVWLIGCNGMLGKELSGVFDSKRIEYAGTDKECDITDVGALRSFTAGKKIKWIINCSAYTAVDRAEDEEAIARAVNATGAGNIALMASEIGANMVHISTDYVFAGNGTRPYLESDPVAPAGAYGRTKLEGEVLVAQNCPCHWIIRTAWLYGKHGNNFVHTMLRLMSEKDSLSVVCDQKGSPTLAYDLAIAIAALLEKGDNLPDPGIYHFTDEGETTWYDFARLIQNIALEKGLLSKRIPVNSVTSDKYPTKAVRPAYSVLDKSKIRSSFGIVIPRWEASLESFLDMKAKESR